MFGQKFLTGPRPGDLDIILVGKFERPPAGISRRNFGWKLWIGPRLGEPEGFFVGKRESEALGEMDGDVVGCSEEGCLSIKQTGPGSANGWNGCEVGSLDG